MWRNYEVIKLFGTKSVKIYQEILESEIEWHVFMGHGVYLPQTQMSKTVLTPSVTFQRRNLMQMYHDSSADTIKQASDLLIASVSLRRNLVTMNQMLWKLYVLLTPPIRADKTWLNSACIGKRDECDRQAIRYYIEYRVSTIRSKEFSWSYDKFQRPRDTTKRPHCFIASEIHNKRP